MSGFFGSRLELVTPRGQHCLERCAILERVIHKWIELTRDTSRTIFAKAIVPTGTR